MVGFPLTKEQAEKTRYVYYELGYYNDELLYKKSKHNRLENFNIEYFNPSKRKKDSLRNIVDNPKLIKLDNGKEASSLTNSQSTFTDIEEYKNYRVFETERYGTTNIIYQTGVLLDDKLIAERYEDKPNMNFEGHKSSYSFSKNSYFVKHHFNSSNKLTLYCKYYTNYEDECFVCKHDKTGSIEEIETFKLSEFNTIKQKYFPLEDISYLEDDELRPSNSYIKNLKSREQKRHNYTTVIGTKTSKEFLSLLDIYNKHIYRDTILKKIETHKNNEIHSVTYYLDEEENYDVILKSLSEELDNYIIITNRFSEYKAPEIIYSYQSDSLVKKERIQKNENNKIIQIDTFKEEDDFSKVDNSKTVKILYRKNNNPIFFLYNKNGSIREIRVGKNSPHSNILDNTMTYNWIKIKSMYFPYEDVWFYSRANF